MAHDADHVENKPCLLEPTVSQLEYLAKLAISSLESHLTQQLGAVAPAPRLRRRLSPAQVSAIVQRYQNRTSTLKLAKTFNVSKTAVLKLLREEGIEPRREAVPEHLLAKATEAYDSGLPLTEVARSLNVSASSLRRRMVAGGVELRPRGRQPATPCVLT